MKILSNFFIISFIFSSLIISLPSVVKASEFNDPNLADEKVQQEQMQSFLYRERSTGFVKKSYLIKRNGLQASFLIHIPPNPFIFKKQNGFEFDLGKNFDNYFIQLQIQKMALLFSEVVETTSLYAPGAKTFDSTSSFLSVGIGHGLRTYFFKDLLNASKSFETMSFSFSYDSLTETFSGDQFTGFGYQLGLGLYTFSTENFYYGIKVNYHMSNLRRPPLTQTETTSSRSITLSWLTVGLNLSMYLD